MENKKSHKKSFRIYLSIVAVLLLLQVVAWSSRSLSDAYIDYIFPIWVNTYGRITGLFPFSVGEWLIVAGTQYGGVHRDQLCLFLPLQYVSQYHFTCRIDPGIGNDD